MKTKTNNIFSKKKKDQNYKIIELKIEIDKSLLYRFLDP